MDIPCRHVIPSIPCLLVYLLPYPYHHLIAMSDIYCHEDVLDFTDPFINYRQGHVPLYPVSTTVVACLVSPKTVLPETPLTR